MALEIGVELIAAAGSAGLALGAAAYAARWPTSQLFGKTMVAPPRPNEIALTFDDGPNPRCTPLLLDTLDRHEVKATFFLIGQYAASQPALVRRIHAAGHLIGNHTWTHPDLAMTSAAGTREELKRTQGELESTLGAPVRYFRPPFGSRRPSTLRIAREIGLTPVMWNAMVYDWNTKSAQTIFLRAEQLVMKNTRRAAATNLLLHDGGHLTLETDREATVVAAGLLMEQFGQSHRFVTVDSWESQAGDKD